ncbi:hypothetical protein [Paucihalobacter sp.]|uniref:hypothetical protein n=1 Tax=Paucihalobacter sp. TaxID=2850405 RepID=UPI002FE22293
MSKLQHKSTRLESNWLHKDKKLSRKAIILGSIVGTLVAATPFLFYLYIFIPDEVIWENFLFTYKSGFYESAQIGMWMILGKVIPVLLLFIWFFTCKHWWYHAIIVPIAMYSYQIAGIINSESRHFDEFKLMYLVPLMAIIIPSIYLIRAQMFNKLNDAGKTMEELEAEFMIKPTTVWGKVKQFF